MSNNRFLKIVGNNHKGGAFKCYLGTFVISIILGAFATQAAVTVESSELTQQQQWLQQNLLTATNVPPFSFIYQGKPSSAFLTSWERREVTTYPDSNRIQHVIIWKHNGLQVKCVAVEYRDFPEVEWTVYLKNIGTNNTPIIENIQGLDTRFLRTTKEPEFVLNGIKGDFTSAESYEPYQITLGPGSTNEFAPPGSGKSSDGPKGWPYYNLQIPDGGVILAIGWPGQWASSFVRDNGDTLRVEAGQQLTHLFLKPGEEIRTPLMAMLFWRGTDVVRAQNIWRHFYIAHIIPRVDGKPQGPLKQIQVNGDNADYVQTFLDAGIVPDICWRDAGAGGTTWYPSDVGPYHEKDSWLNTGTWEVDARKFPDSFKPFSDWVHKHNMKFVLWFEPERVGSPDSWLGKNHPEWLLHPGSVGLILNEGNPEVFNWLTNHIEGLIKSNGIDWYREDMNGVGPCSSWRASDAPDRQGITENFYVQGHLAYWDALRAMNPKLRIDSCASGGRRNDLETMRRAVPLLRSDFQFPDLQKNVIDGNQCQTYGLSSWLPFQGSGIGNYDPYSYRSFYMASFGMGGLTPENKKAQQTAYAECAKIAPDLLFGDYYPLTPYTLKDEDWIAWQFDRPETGGGCVQAFRHPKNEQPEMTFKLQGLNPSGTYEVTNLDKPGALSFSGKELMQNGLQVKLEARGSAVFIYKLVQPTAKN